MDGAVPKPQTIRANHEFRRAYHRGKSQADALLVTYAVRRRYGGVRYGITTSKKLGSAVQRNRARRIIRAAYMQLAPQVQGHWDFVFVARTRTMRAKSTQIAQSMQKQLAKLGALPGTKQGRGQEGP